MASVIREDNTHLLTISAKTLIINVWQGPDKALPFIFNLF